MADRRFTAQPASPGLAIGPVVRIEQSNALGERRQGSPNEERATLERAITKSIADLEALAAVASGDGADILAFQIEMLADPALIEDILPLIAAGDDAAKAWRAGLDIQIHEYEAADDDYFRARASDLRDLEDRVTRVVQGATIELQDLPDGAILLADDLLPSHFLALSSKGLSGIALNRGSRNSHVAILARGRGLPMIVGLDPVSDTASVAGTEMHEMGVDEAILDGDAGLLLLAPTRAKLKHYRKKLSSSQAEAKHAAALRGCPAMTEDGLRIEVMINIDDPTAVNDEALAVADGVGLLRTEFLLIGKEDLPDEEEHFRLYTELLRRLEGKPLIVRTFDIGGDKPLAGLDLPKETNPFLGLRGIRLCLDRPDLIRPQIRALLRTTAAAAGGPLTKSEASSTGGPLQVMLPMVTVQAEIDAARSLFDDALKDLEAEGVAAAMPPLGIMVETPAAALAADGLDAAFFSIGSNDLIQYAMAAARDAEAGVSFLLDPGHPAIERLIRSVVEEGAASGRAVSLCGDMASDPAWLPLLLRIGLRKISVAPAALDRVKLALSRLNSQTAETKT